MSCLTATDQQRRDPTIICQAMRNAFLFKRKAVERARHSPRERERKNSISVVKIESQRHRDSERNPTPPTRSETAVDLSDLSVPDKKKAK